MLKPNHINSNNKYWANNEPCYFVATPTIEPLLQIPTDNKIKTSNHVPCGKTARIISKRAKNCLLILKSYMLIMSTSSENQQVSPLDDFCYFMLMVQDQLAEESKQQRRGEKAERQEYVRVGGDHLDKWGKKLHPPPSPSLSFAGSRG